MRDVYFYTNESNSIVLEENNYENSIFKEQYVQALQLFQHLLEDNQYEQSQNRDSSNILAFCGDRGEGKTSCMMTMKYLLEHQEKNSVRKFLNENHLNKLPAANQIEVLDVIEPLFFDEKHDLRDLIMGRLYEKIRSNKQFEENVSGKRQLQKHLSQCKRYMRSLSRSQEDMYDEMLELELLSGGICLKHKFQDLISDYLKEVKKQYLLIFIDDFDLNVKYAYEMMEYIRKYFSFPRCIFILSCHITQLEKVVGANMAAEQHSDKSSNIPSNVLGTKYINKLIPNSNRVYMPQVRDFCDWPLYICPSRKEHSKEEPDYHSVKDAVVRLIFQKTRYLFYNSKSSVSSIVPDNLRSLRHFINMLLSMEDFQNNDIQGENKKRFKTYFFQVWTRQLKDEHLDFINRLQDNRDVMSFNKMIVSYLDQHFLHSDKLSDEQSLLKAIVNPANSVYNVSVGDALTVINYLMKRETDKDACLFLFFLQSFYSIKLYDYYDKVSKSEIVHTSSEGQTSEEQNKAVEIYQNESWFNQCNVLQRFVNGAYFSYDPSEILPQSSETKTSRDKTIINGENLRKLLSNISDYDNSAADVQEQMKKNFRLFEFFALGIHRYVRNATKHDDIVPLDGYSKEASYRTMSEPLHLKQFNSNMGYFVFDVMAPFYNMLNIEYAYNRFGFKINEKTIYAFAMDKDWSLLNQMMDAVSNSEEKDFAQKEKQLLSDATIRNAEIWMALSELIAYNRQTYKGGGDNLKVISSLYSMFSSLENMAIYADASDKQPQKISFLFFKPVIELLEKNDEKAFNEIFIAKYKKQDASSEELRLEFDGNIRGYVDKYKGNKPKAILNNLKKYKLVLSRNLQDKLMAKQETISKPDLIKFLNEHVEELLPKKSPQETQQSQESTQAVEQPQDETEPTAVSPAEPPTLQEKQNKKSAGSEEMLMEEPPVEDASAEVENSK